MKKSFFISMMVCVLLTACGGQRNIPTAFPSLAPEPSSTVIAKTTPDLTATPTRIQPTEPLSTPTFTPFPPYPNKKVVFEYFTSGNFIAGDDEYFQMFYADYYFSPRLILYDNGLMFTYGKQKILSADEMKKFFAKLDTLGFFSIESNQKHDKEDKLYNFGNRYEEVFDGPKYCIMVNTADKSKELCAYEPYMQFLIPEMKNILKYFDEYKPNGLTPYYPDRILLSIRLANPDSDDMSANATPWDERFPSLEFSLRRTREYAYDIPVSIMYIQGDMAKEIYLFVENSHSHAVFIQNGKKYIVHIDIILPHETVINAYQ
jgi:hypothetical protein